MLLDFDQLQNSKFDKRGRFNNSRQPRYLGAELWFTGALLCFEVVGRKFHCLFWSRKVCLDKSNEKITAWSNKPLRFRYCPAPYT